MNANRREVAVTGMGAVSPFGMGIEPLWNGVSGGHRGINWIEDVHDLDPAIYPIRYAAAVKNFSVDEHLKRHCEVRAERSVQMGLVTARQALAQAGLLTPGAAGS
jgi:3-oxoacyl-[acyl-carrier-protein] synthase II